MKFFQRKQPAPVLGSGVSYVPRMADVTYNLATGPFQASSAPSRRRNFDAADIGRLFADWVTGTTTRNDKLRSSLRTMRIRARAAAENDELALNYLELCRNNIIGPDGITLKMEVRDEDGSFDQRANDLIMEAWQEWCKKKHCTVTRGMSWWEFRRMLVTEEPQTGEIFLRLWEGFDNDFGFAVQVIDADCIDEDLNQNLKNGNRIRMGIEKNPWGEVVAYWVRVENPYDSMSKSAKYDRVPASQMIHKFVPLGVNQIRGIPWFHAPLDAMRMLEKFNDAALVAARIGAAQRGFFEELPDANGQYQGEGEDEEGNTQMNLGAGEFAKLPRGIKFNHVASDYPHAQYAPFIKAHQRTIAAGLPGANYNELTGDYEAVNYSSFRAAVLGSQDVWRSLQAHGIDNIELPVFERFLRQALLRRKISLPADKYAKFNKPRFIGRGWPWVDPTTEVEAAIKAIEAGLDSASGVVGGKGGDIDRVYAAQERDRKLAKDYGLNFDGQKQKQRAETLGIAARAGLYTPSRDDENAFRTDNQMPAASKEVQSAWDQSAGVRLPVSLQTPDNFELGQNGAAATPKK